MEQVQAVVVVRQLVVKTNNKIKTKDMISHIPNPCHLRQ